MDLGIRPETLQQKEDKVDPNIYHVGLGSDFLNKTPKAQEMKARINTWDGFKLKSFFSTKGTINNMKMAKFNNKVYLKIAKRVDLQCSHHTCNNVKCMR